VYDGIDLGSNRGCDSDIVIDGNDHIYISYQVRDQSKLKVATNKSGSWDLYTADSGASLSSLYPGYMTSMVMDGQGQLHIAHFDDKDDDLRYSTGITNGQWTTTIVEHSGHTGREPSIAVDAADNPHIVYHSWSSFNLKYATLNPTTSNWATSTISTADVGNGDSLFIDQNGVMHVSFYDGDSEIMNYATKSTGLSQTNEIRVQFGQYGSVTGTVVDDTTITVSTPLSGLTPDTIGITLWDKDDNSHILSSTFEFISQDDLDNDGVLNANDDCPNDAGTSTQDLTGCPDDDGDGYSNSGDAFPNEPSQWNDTDGDGCGDRSSLLGGSNADAFPLDSTQCLDFDADGYGDNQTGFQPDACITIWGNSTKGRFGCLDDDGDGWANIDDMFPLDATEHNDTDGDGVGDNSDWAPNDATESQDSDGDGVGDNSDAFPNDANETLDSDGDGIGDINDLCINTMQNNSVDTDGCSLQQLNDDTNETDDTQNNQTNNTNQSEEPVDTDGDGVPDLEDNCPATSPGTIVDAQGCELDESQDEEESNSAFESFFSGDSGAVTTTVGIGAILLALFTLLQTNAAAAILPDTFRWVQVLRKNSKLTKEERNELTYLQSLIQAYHSNPEELAEELVKLKGDITARFTNNQIKKETREKLLILIEELQSSTPNELYQIAHNEAYFGLSEVIDTNERTDLLEEKLAMSAGDDQQQQSVAPSAYSLGELDDKGTYWIEYPEDSGTWYYRYAPEQDWAKFES